jgi:hypothetical protein
MEFRIAQIADDPRGVLTGAFVFSPPPHLPEVPRVLVERFGAENTRLGPHGWAVDSPGLRPRLIEKRGPELWLCFGAEMSFHVLPDTGVRVSLVGTDVVGEGFWPPIPRGKAAPADIPTGDDPWPEPEAPKPPPPPPPPPPKAKPPEDDATVIVAPPPVPPPPAPPPVTANPPPSPPVIVDRRPWPLIAAALILLVAAGGAAWWFLRPEPPPVQVATPTPPPPPPPANPDCAEAADVLSGKCALDKLAALPPPEQTRLAEALLKQGGSRANSIGTALLTAAAAAGHPPARLALAKLYDPANARDGAPLRPNPARALAEYAAAAEAGLAEAKPARDALVARLKQQAAGADATLAEAARDALRAAGID